MSNPVQLPVLIFVDDEVASAKAVRRVAERRLKGSLSIEMFSDPQSVQNRVRLLRETETPVYIISDGDLISATNQSGMFGPELLRVVRDLMGESLFLGGCLISSNPDRQEESKKDGFFVLDRPYAFEDLHAVLDGILPPPKA